MNFHNVAISPESIERVAAVLRSGWVSEGAQVAEFEAGLERHGLTRPVATNSGTAALHLAMTLCGVGAGDEVIIPAQTFVATATAALQCGAKVVFADVDPETGNISPVDIEQRITPKTRAIIPVHYGGLPCNMFAISDIGYRYSVPIIEDAAHALGAAYNSIPIGSIPGDFAAFSFQAIKHLTCGDGGALCCPNADKASEARCLRWFGIDRARSAESELGYREYNIKRPGYKYHMNDIAAAVGNGNLIDFASRLRKRKANAAVYRRELASVPGITLIRVDADVTHSYWLFTILVDRRLDFIRAMRARGVPASVVHRRIDVNDMLGGRRDDLPGTDYFDEHQVSLPVHEALTDDDIGLVVDAVRGGW